MQTGANYLLSKIKQTFVSVHQFSTQLIEMMLENNFITKMQPTTGSVLYFNGIVLVRTNYSNCCALNIKGIFWGYIWAYKSVE